MMIAPQELANSLWAVSELQQECGWKPKQQQRVWERLLGEQQLARVASRGNSQEVSNVLLALGHLVSAQGAVISKEFAQQCVQQLLQGATARSLRSWNDRDVGNAMWCCVKVGLVDQSFFDRAEAATAWSERAAFPAVTQVAYACGALQMQRPELIARASKRAKQLCSAAKRSKGSAKHKTISEVRTPAALG
jgi:hypothetical protein